MRSHTTVPVGIAPDISDVVRRVAIRENVNASVLCNAILRDFLFPVTDSDRFEPDASPESLGQSGEAQHGEPDRIHPAGIPLEGLP
jgi:hypothetical protein